MMTAQHLEEHNWLARLVDEWTFETECSMGPDQPPSKVVGTEIVRSLGGHWTVGEGECPSPEGGWKSIMTLGYDLATKRFVGTFVASMMTYLWIYNGSLDADKKVLTLDAEGPNWTDGSIIKYQDLVEFLSDDHRTLSSQTLDEDGQWHPFMKAHYRRKR
jgi:hypothetical protein